MFPFMLLYERRSAKGRTEFMLYALYAEMSHTADCMLDVSQAQNKRRCQMYKCY
jgi:hypothetical protein